jgi:hypothetical protein
MDAIIQKGLTVVAISYDSVAVLKNFGDRHHITYAMLSDPDSKIIRAFGILNESVPKTTAQYGIPYPGTFIVDSRGKVISKYFEDDYKERVSASDILVRQFGTPADATGAGVETKHLRVTTAASTSTARPGQKIALSLDLDLNPKMHVYSPGVQGYIPIDWKLDEGPFVKLHAFDYPPSQQLRLEVIQETVPVYQGRVRLSRDITFGPEGALKPLIATSGDLILKGSLRYQACDDHECFLPQTVPLEWSFHFEGLDRERAPADLQRKPK